MQANLFNLRPSGDHNGHQHGSVGARFWTSSDGQAFDPFLQADSEGGLVLDPLCESTTFPA